MAVVSEFEVAADEFVLGRVLTAEIDVEVDVERVVPSSSRIMPYVWVGGREVDTFGDRVAAREVVDAIVEVDRLDGRILYRIDWNDDLECFVTGLETHRATILEARGGDRWHFRLRFPAHDDLSGFHEYCSEHDIGLSLVRIRSIESQTAERFELTPEQRRALELATERGYFEIPREVTLSELADELGISTQAASERLRRGTNSVLQSEVGEDGTRR